MPQYHKIIRKQNENAKAWMGYLRIKTNACGYKKKDERLREQFINSINDDDMMIEIYKRIDSNPKTNNVTCEEVLACVMTEEVQSTQKQNRGCKRE